MLPSLQLLEKVSKEIVSVPNRKGEQLRQVHYGCYLLCHKSGLRVSESVSFDLANKTRQGLYRIKKSKGKKERLVYVSKEVIGELKKQDWKPNQTNRFNFYHFLKKIKRELNVSKSVELSPYTLRRSFATYQAEFGLPLPLLQKLLGHSSIRTTALYWRNVYGDDGSNDDTGSILAGKIWLENKQKAPLNFPEQPPANSEPSIIPKIPSIPAGQKPVIPVQKPTIKPNSPPLIFAEPKPAKTNFQPEPLASQIQPKPAGKIFPPTSKAIQQPEISEQLPLTATQQNPPTEKEGILLTKIKQLEEKLKSAEAIATQEKNRADNYHQQLKTIGKMLYQLQKINYYQQLEQEIYSAEQRTKTQAQIIQPPPWKPVK